MNEIVLRDLPADIQQLIETRARTENIDETRAVIEVLKDAAIESAVQHDVALFESWAKEEGEFTEHHVALPHVSITVNLQR